MLSRLDFSSGYAAGMSILIILQQLLIVIIALSFHEVAHGLAAKLLGDNTADSRGRLSLNPLHHLDPIGFICMALFGFGWAKPVPIDARNFKNPKLGMALSALAGPMMNLILAFVSLIPYEIILSVFGRELVMVNYGVPFENEFLYNVLVVSLNFLLSFHIMNISLAVFNFIPVPPLDGSRVLYALLPDKLYFGVMRYERYISMGLMLLLFMGFLDSALMWVTTNLSEGMQWLLPIL